MSPIFILAQSTTTIGVRGNCGMCKETIEKTAMTVMGVNSAKYDLETETLTVETDENFDEMNLHLSITSVGYDTDEMEASTSSYDQLPACCQYDRMADNFDSKGKFFELEVSGRCGMCKNRIEEAAENVNGVKSSSYIIEEQKLSVRIKDDFIPMDLHKAIAAAGHDTELIKASNESYSSLPGCCLYRDLGTPTDDFVHGVIYEMIEGGEEIPLIGATVVWNQTNNGVVTDEEGYFELPRIENIDSIVVSYVGFEPEKVDMKSNDVVKVVLKSNFVLDEVGITASKKTASVSYLETMKSLNITDKELLKAACCSLAESFVTTASVDNTVADAVTGTRKIEMLGLQGQYLMISRSNMPDVRALSTVNGLSFVPGPWIQSMQINPGTASVANGFEGMTGQINVETRKPDAEEKLIAHVYGNQSGRLEANLIFNQKINDKVSTGLMLHGNLRNIVNDNNDDGFLDMPLGQNYIVQNNWKWKADNGLRGQFTAKYLQSSNEAGQEASIAENDNLWTADNNVNRLEIANKMGYVFPNRTTASIGTQLMYVNQDQSMNFGGKNHVASQNLFYANFLYKDQLGSDVNSIKTGLSFQYDDITEVVDFLESETEEEFIRNEMIPGAFIEYTFSPSEKFNAVAGLRGDLHNQYGFYFTPRLHLRYAPTENTVFRVSGGQGRRTGNIFAENMGYLANGRVWNIDNGDSSEKPYGLDQEISWNAGINFSQKFYTGAVEHLFQLDAYRTEFQNQIVVDIDGAYNELSIYNLDGKSFSNSIQLQYEVEPLERLLVRLAYRFNDAQTEYKSIGLKRRPLVSPHRAFINVGYETENQWNFDFTLNWVSSTRLPAIEHNNLPESYSVSTEDYLLGYAHISKMWGEKWELFLGVENLFNYRQPDPIIEAENPFSDEFDASLVWGPIFGRNIYIGGRYTLK